jgi:hypothetical protein
MHIAANDAIGKLLIYDIANTYIIIAEGGMNSIFGYWRLRKYFNMRNF